MMTEEITETVLEAAPADNDQKIRFDTTRFGEVEVPETNVIHMPHGILGFPAAKDYVLLPHKENSPFLWYQSVSDPTLAFVLVNPFMFKPDYDVPIGPDLVESLHAESIGEITVLAIVTIPRNRPQDMTANLLGPIVINPAKRLARQIVLDPDKYSTKAPILSNKN
ncbi:MAG: flagellar assembly protein FliW [Pseudomonadota bacterium]